MLRSVLHCNIGCDVDIRMLKLNPGEIPRTDMFYRYEDVGGWRLDPHEQNFAIHNSAYEQGKFVFYSSDPGKMKDENRKNQENLRSVFEVTFTPEAYSLYFKMRNDDNEGVTNVRFPKRPDGNLRDALKKLEEKKTTEEKKKIKEKYKLEKNKMMQEKKLLEAKYNTKKREIMDEKMRVEEKEMMEEAMKMEKEKWINEEKRMEEEYKMVLNEWETKMGRIEEFQVQEKERIEEIEKYFAESCFFDGQTIFGSDKLIRYVGIVEEN